MSGNIIANAFLDSLSNPSNPPDASVDQSHNLTYLQVVLNGFALDYDLATSESSPYNSNTSPPLSYAIQNIFSNPALLQSITSSSTPLYTFLQTLISQASGGDTPISAAAYENLSLTLSNFLGISDFPRIAASTYTSNPLVSPTDQDLYINGITPLVAPVTAQNLYGTTPNVQDGLLQSTFAEFLKDYTDPGNPDHFVAQTNPAPPLSSIPQVNGSGSSITQFVTAFFAFIQPTIAMTNASATGNLAGTPTYEQAYFQAFPNSSQADFVSFTTNFMKSMQSQYGYFLPSQFYSQFQQAVASQAAQNALVLSTNGSGSAKVKVVIEVLFLLISMLDTIQNSGIQQSSRLQFLTNWQTAYTQTANNIPTLTAATPIPSPGQIFGSTDRGEENAKLQAYAQNLRDFRSIVSDSAKSLQANMNQSQEASNSQSNLITAILQQMSTIMQSLFRS